VGPFASVSVITELAQAHLSMVRITGAMRSLLARQACQRQNGLAAALLRIIARRPVLACMVIGLDASFLTVAIPPIVNAQVLPFDMPLHGVLGGALDVGVGAFVVTGALAGRDGVVDLARRSLRWRVEVRWYLVALFTVPVAATLISLVIYGSTALASPAGGWPRALAEVAVVLVLQLVLFQLAEQIGFPVPGSTIGRTGITP
jgi:hypothetical protein